MSISYTVCLKLVIYKCYLKLIASLNFAKLPQEKVYLEECKYKIKKIQMPRFINTELELDSCSGSEELMTKLKLSSDSE